MNRIIVDTSCLIVLEKIESLDILRSLFAEVWITQEISEEFDRKLPPWILTMSVKNKGNQYELGRALDGGEASAIALAMETNTPLIIDEKKGRMIAATLNVKVWGTLRLLLEAKQRKVIDEVGPLLVKMRKEGFWISPVLQSEVLRLAGEQ